MMPLKDALNILKYISGYGRDQDANTNKNIKISTVQTKGHVIRSEKLIQKELSKERMC